MSTAVNMFLSQVVLVDEIPFPVTYPRIKAFFHSIIFLKLQSVLAYINYAVIYIWRSKDEFFGRTNCKRWHC